MNICKQEHRYDERFESLPLDQGGPGRHRCSGCAYQLGYDAGKRGDRRFQLDLDSLPESQAGSVRHRDPEAAFQLGLHLGALAARGA
ncbi:hypothetical protein [Pseudoxanthomonas beigongshangi]|uniref:hypothetical protein n=1 Tax=Pseudoxanthomonas beigongshangi TaxID=2782537 RepID=UPI00193B1152|nr:hypothetical protein [Pseudoxanthomonas beigongshangi]